MPHKYRLTCLVDNTVQFDSAFWAEHGISFLVESKGIKALFDTGQTATVLQHNLSLVGEDLKDLRYIILSHGHYDHTGGLRAALAQATRVTIFAHPKIFGEKYARREDGLKSIGIPFSREDVECQGQLQLTKESVEIAQGIWTTGQIARLTDFELGDARLLTKKADGTLIQDEVPDDQALVLEMDEGLVVLLGCCHAGLINTLAHVRRLFGQPIYAIVGGTHLQGATEERVAKTIMAVRDEYRPQQVYLNHCTGEKAFCLFSQTMGEKVRSCPVGTVLTF